MYFENNRNNFISHCILHMLFHLRLPQLMMIVMACRVLLSSRGVLISSFPVAKNQTHYIVLKKKSVQQNVIKFFILNNRFSASIQLKAHKIIVTLELCNLEVPQLTYIFPILNQFIVIFSKIIIFRCQTTPHFCKR